MCVCVRIDIYIYIYLHTYTCMFIHIEIQRRICFSILFVKNREVLVQTPVLDVDPCRHRVPKDVV